ncbi:multidrug resistance-like protein [Xylariaceae sp. FL0804]|nr:multidrug resistance-like protein [Xylariaceae sp. FL0804]
MNNTHTVGCFPAAEAAFGPAVHGCRDDFDFTLSFEQYFLSIAPAGLLLVAAPLRIRHLSKLPLVVRGRPLRTVKSVAIAVFAALQLSLLALWTTRSSGTLRSVTVASSSLSFAAALVLCVLSLAEHARSVRPSFLLNAYLFLSLVFDGAILRTYWLAGAPLAIRALFAASFAIKAAILVLEAKEKQKYIIGSRRSPEETSGLYSQGLFWWVNSLLLGGFRTLLGPSDLYPMAEEMSTTHLSNDFRLRWSQATSGGKYKLLGVCVKTLRWSLVAAIFPRLILLAFTISQPLLLKRFLDYLERPTEAPSIGYGLIAAYGLVYVGLAISGGFYWYRAVRTSTSLRGMLVSAIFQKSTRISTTATDNVAAVTLMSTDAETIEVAVRSVHELWALLLQVALATWLLSIQLGAAAAGPVLVCVIATAATTYLAPKTIASQRKWFGHVQKRVGVTSTLLGSIKSIKMSGLALNVSAAIAQMRAEEMIIARPFRTILALLGSLAQVPQLLSPVVSFAIFSGLALRSGETLEATKLFSSLSLIVLLSQPVFSALDVLASVLGALASFGRIQKFLDAESRTDYRLQPPDSTQPSGEAASQSLTRGFEMKPLHETEYIASASSADSRAIVLTNASFAWSLGAPTVVRNVNIRASAGQLLVVVGPVASGKSTLLRGILGEVPVAEGHISFSTAQRTSWCDQSPWMRNDSVRNNILGFNLFDSALYDQVIYACDLRKDLDQFVDGDATLIGSKGISLSGGQKQRISLARAIYSHPEIAICDDVLSGLDNYTSKTVCNRVFSKSEGILRQWGTTVVLATQTASCLPLADQIAALSEEGAVVEQGTLETLIKQDGYVNSIYKNGASRAVEDAVTVDETWRERAEKTIKQAPALDARRQQGDFTVYRYYFASLGAAFTTIMLGLEAAFAFFSTFPTVWLKWWADATAAEGNESIGFYLGIYAALQVLAVICFSCLSWFLFTRMISKSGIELHHKLLRAVIRAPLSFFTNTDTGSITTRFSQDLGLLDRSLPLGMLVTLATFLMSIGQAALLASATGYIAISFPFLVVVFYCLQKAFLRTSRQLRFLDLEEKAPVYTQFIETLAGLSTIRAFAWEKQAIALNHELVDRSQKPFYFLLMVQRWLNLVLDLIVAALAILVVGVSVKLRDSLSVGLTGVSLVQLITFASTMQLLIQWWTSLETSIGAVARIKRFSEDTPDENLPGESHSPPESWPARGAIDIQGVSARYHADSETKVLDDISISVAPGEKVGIVGRTGSGKSSLLLTLVRMLDLSSGQIHIDGLDISTMPREDVRSRLLTVTQDQFFLPGNVRTNIDPAGASSPAEIDGALEKVGLRDAVRERGGLDAAFDEDALSHGQRQLFFLARALLLLRKKHRGRVVLLDEATSSVDHHTEQRVRELIVDEFRNHTLLAIAHRLDTVIDFDRVVVLDRGCVVEQGNPRELLSRRGPFRKLWDAASRSAD